jgi:hypothetical protein
LLTAWRLSQLGVAAEDGIGVIGCCRRQTVAIGGSAATEREQANEY